MYIYMYIISFFCHLNSSMNKTVESKQIKICSTFNYHCVVHLHTLPGTKTHKDCASILSMVYIDCWG